MSNKEFWCRHGNIMLTGEHCGACAAGDEPLGEDLRPVALAIGGLSAEASAIGGLSAEALA